MAYPQVVRQGRRCVRGKARLDQRLRAQCRPWLIAEPPLAAHTNYFRNDDVWQAIVCGATAGKLLDCKR